MTTTISRTRGDDWEITGTLSASGSPIDLTTATVTAQMRRTIGSSVAATFTVTVTSAATGEISLALSDTITEGIDPGIYLFDVQVVIGVVTTTYGNDGAPWRLAVIGDVTR